MGFLLLLLSISLTANLQDAIVTRDWPSIYNHMSLNNSDEKFYLIVSLLRMRQYGLLYQFLSIKKNHLKKPEYFALLYSSYNTPLGDSLFNDLIETGLNKYPDMGDFLLYLRINKNISLQKTGYVLLDLRVMKRKYPASTFMEYSVILTLRYLYSNTEYQKFLKTFNDYKKYLKSRYNRAEAYYYYHRILLLQKKKTLAKRIADLLLTRYYRTPFSFRVIKSGSKKYPFYKGLSAFYNGHYKIAIKYLKKSSIHKKFHYLTIAYYRAGYYSRILKLYRKKLIPDSLRYYVALAYERKKKFRKALREFLYTVRHSERYSGYAAYEISFILVNNPKIYRKAGDSFPLNIPNPDYLLRMGLIYMVYGERNRAIAFFEKALKSRDSFVKSQSLYWLYRITGISAYRDNLLKEHPFSYFAWITRGEKEITSVDSLAYPLIKNNHNFLSKGSQYWDRFHIFTFLGLNNYALRELKKCRKDIKECVEFAYLTGVDNLTVEIFRKFKSLESKKESLIFGYPLAYWYFIKGETENPFLFISLLREESHFNHMAISPAGAVGIAQIMPYTASKIMGRRVKKDELLDPYFNMKLGMRYLNKLLERYRGNEPFALAAYNAGEKRVDRWLKKYSKFGINEDPYLFVEFIPFRETRNYVRRIIKDYKLYIKLYSRITEKLLDRQAS